MSEKKNCNAFFYFRVIRVPEKTVSKKTVLGDGTEAWHFGPKLHRLDGPALKFPSGSEYWYFMDKIHREDGPAIILSNGTKQWVLNGKFHREDGPAIEKNKGESVYYLHGKRLTKEEWWSRLSGEKKLKILFPL